MLFYGLSLKFSCFDPNCLVPISPSDIHCVDHGAGVISIQANVTGMEHLGKERPDHWAWPQVATVSSCSTWWRTSHESEVG